MQLFESMIYEQYGLEVFDCLRSSYEVDKSNIITKECVHINICIGFFKPPHEDMTFLQGSTGHELSPVKQADWGPVVWKRSHNSRLPHY